MQLTALLPGDRGELWVLADAPPRLTGPDPSPVFRVGEPPEPKPTERDANTVPVVGYRPRQDPDVVSHVLLRRPGSGWTTDARLIGQLRTIARLKDGTVAAGGDCLLIRDHKGEWSLRSAPALLDRIWGVSLSCLYALGEEVHEKGRLGKSGLEATWVSHRLFYFDGKQWVEIDVGPGFFVDGASDADGRSWIVGTYGTHSCMATGKGTDWRRDGCSSWYLYRVHIDDGGQAFALGGDGLWRHEAGGWFDVKGFGGGAHFPMALSSFGGRPWVITYRIVPPWRIERGEEQGPFAFHVFMDGTRAAVPTPEGFNPREGASIALSPLGGVVVGQGEMIWESPPVTDVVPVADHSSEAM